MGLSVQCIIWWTKLIFLCHLNYIHTCLHSNTDKSMLYKMVPFLFFYRKVRVFSVLGHKPGAELFINAVFAATGKLTTHSPNSSTGSMQKIWKHKAPQCRAQIYSLTGTLGHLVTHYFGTFSISSFPCYFLLSEINFNMASRKIVDTDTLQQKYKPHFELPKNSVLRLQKAEYRSWHNGSERLWDVPPKTQNWAYIFQTENK